MSNSSQGKKGGKKIGRIARSPSHARYNGTNRRETNRLRKLKKHLKQQPNDKTAIKALGIAGRTK